MKKTDSFPGRGTARAFTLLEVALIVAIIGMMLMMIVGYMLAPKQTGPLPPVAAPALIPPSTAPSTPSPKAATTSVPGATPAGAPQTIDLSPQGSPIFR